MPKFTKQDLFALCEANELEVPQNITKSELYKVAVENKLITEEENESWAEACSNHENNSDEENQQRKTDELASAMKTVSLTDETETDLDAQLVLLRKRREIMMLQKEIDDMSKPKDTTSKFLKKSHISYQTIENSIVKFSGDDRSHGIHEFLRSFDDVMLTIDADETFRMICLRNSLEGTARLLLRSGYLEYEDLRSKLIEEFGRKVNRREIYQRLRARTWNKTAESLHRYVIEMEAIAHQSDVTEQELLSFIVDGIGENSNEAVILYNAVTIKEFKHAIEVYERRVEGRTKPKPMPTKVENKTAVVAKVNTPGATNIANPTNEPRCFNCSRLNHLSTECPYEIRPRDICYRCWGKNHDRRNCTNPKYIQKLKAAAAQVGVTHDENEADDELADARSISAVGLVSVAFNDNSNKRSEFKKCLSLFDTGSAINLIQRSIYPYAVIEKLTSSKYRGIGQTVIKYFKHIVVSVKIDNRISQIKLMIVPDDALPVPIIYGRPALRALNIKLCQINNKPKDILIKQTEGENKRLNSLCLKPNVLDKVVNDVTIGRVNETTILKVDKTVSK